MNVFENQIGTLLDICSSSYVATKVLNSTKKLRRGKRFVALSHPDYPKAVFEIDASKYNENRKRYAEYQVVGNGVWE